MYKTNLTVNVSTNIDGTDGEDLICNIFDALMARLSEFADDGLDIFHTSMDSPLLAKSKESLIGKLPIITRYLSKDMDLSETITNKFDYDTGRYDELEISIKYNEYNTQTFNQRTGEYTVKFTKDKHGEIITNTNHGSTERENKDIDELINKRFIEVGELLSVDWFLANHTELARGWQNDEKTKINREALKYHGIDASDDEVYLSFFEAIHSIKDSRSLLFSSLYTMLLTTPSGKAVYQQYVKDLFETRLALNAPETLKCLNDMTRKFNCLDDNLSTTTWSPLSEE